jgi:hypothetical protein
VIPFFITCYLSIPLSPWLIARIHSVILLTPRIRIGGHHTINLYLYPLLLSVQDKDTHRDSTWIHIMLISDIGRLRIGEMKRRTS